MGLRRNMEIELWSIFFLEGIVGLEWVRVGQERLEGTWGLSCWV